MFPDDKKKISDALILFGIIYVFALFFSLHYLHAVAENPDNDLFDNIIAGLSSVTESPLGFGNPFAAGLSQMLITFIVITGLVGMLYMLYQTSEQAKQHAADDKGKGSAKWNKDYKGFRRRHTLEDKDKKHEDVPSNNLILAQDLYYGLKEGNNVNVTIIGGAGTGKSFGVINAVFLAISIRSRIFTEVDKGR